VAGAKPSVSIVIATYNRCQDLKECLRTVFDLETKPLEVIVVDSNSADDTAKAKDWFPIKYASTRERNREHARNLGISMAKGDIVAFLDDDVIVSREWLSHLVEPYSDGRVGGVGGRVIPYGASGRAYARTGRREIGKVFRSGLVIGNFDFPSENPVEVDSFIGCNMSFRRELLLRVGGFDEKYVGTGYRDDTDLCVRIRRLGNKLLYQPKALVQHKFRGKRIDSNWVYWYVRNHTYFYLKNIFAQYRVGLPLFLYHMFFPPRDYVLKSGVKLKIEPRLVLSALRGFCDGCRAFGVLTS
jgi:GT2 family glycosyltransferase